MNAINTNNETISNISIAKLFREVAAAYEVQNEKKYFFQIRAYRRAMDIIENSNIELKDLWRENKLDNISGIGKTISSYINELFKTGKVNHFQQIKAKIPQPFFTILQIPGVGPKTAIKIVNNLKITDTEHALDKLLDAAKHGKVAMIPGFGEKIQNHIILSIEKYQKNKAVRLRMILPYAYEIAQKISDYLRKCPQVKQVSVLGSLRRMCSTVGDIDISVASDSPLKVITWVKSYPNIEKMIEAGKTTISFYTNGGKQIDIMIQPPAAYGALLAHFTGSKAHNIRLRTFAVGNRLSISEYGIKSNNRKYSKKYIPHLDKKSKIYKFTDEKEFYGSLGLEWIPPELREDNGEIQMALKHQLPKLIKSKDIKGDLHLHSSYNIEPSHDLGANSMEEMLKKAENLGYEYLGFSEHNPSITNHTSDSIYTLLSKRKDCIEQLQQSTKSIHIFTMMEVDILTDGNLALSEKSQDLLDAMIVSVHSGFDMQTDKMTDRILCALKNKKAKILGHPTGRILNYREGYGLNWDKLFRFCKDEDKALEINSYPTRLDLPDLFVYEAIQRGIKIIINTDSHQLNQMYLMKFGVSVARRGWAVKDNIINTRPLEKFRKWLVAR